jgi:hypothetical protein
VMRPVTAEPNNADPPAIAAITSFGVIFIPQLLISSERLWLTPSQ